MCVPKHEEIHISSHEQFEFIKMILDGNATQIFRYFSSGKEKIDVSDINQTFGNQTKLFCPIWRWARTWRLGARYHVFTRLIRELKRFGFAI